MVNASTATESLLKHVTSLWMFAALILTACGAGPRPPGPVAWEEVGNFQDIAQFDQAPPLRQAPHLKKVATFDRSAYKGPLGIDLAMDTSNVVEELRGGRIDFVARYYRQPTSSLPALSPQEARKLASLGLKIVAVWEHNSPDPENLSYSSGYSDASSAYQQAKAVGQPAGSAIYFAIDFNARELESAKEYFRGIAAGLTAASGGRAEYHVGVYGSGAVCDAIKRAGLARYSWLGKATSWDGSLDYNDWNIKQGEALPFSFDNDSNEARGDYGGFRLREL
jgi:Rv2525c-like, glycoside hydrolase-like domain